MIRIFYYLFLLSISSFSIVIIIIVSILWRYGNSLPDYKQLKSYKPPMVSRLYTQDGKLLEEYSVENRVYIPISAVPKTVIGAFLVTEDKNFYKHEGIDFKGVSRAIIHNLINIIKDKRLVGASTITQQVAKNFLLSNEVSFERKIKEALLALRIERTLSKDKILELYLNEIFLGFRSYGIVTAAQNYFNKSINELTLSEIAFLAGLPKAPNNYNPITNVNAAKARRNYVLKRMIEEGIVHRTDAENASREDIKINKRSVEEYVDAPYFSEEVRKKIISNFSREEFYNGGFFVSTTLNSTLQRYAEDALTWGIESYDKRRGWRGELENIGKIDIKDDWLNIISKLSKNKNFTNKVLAVVIDVTEERIVLGLSNGDTGFLDLNESSWTLSKNKENSDVTISSYLNNVLNVGSVVWVNKNFNKDDSVTYSLWQIPEVNGAIVVMDTVSGKVLALVGGYDYNLNKFNRATQALRQSGSAFKPFVYLSALENGMTPATMILDTPLVIDQGPGLEEWIPKNYTGSYYGASTLRTGLEKSRNVMTVRLANTIGIEKIVEIANRFHIGNYPAQLATSLGAGETTLLNLTTAYASFINGGMLIRPKFIESIHDREGKSVYKRDSRKCKLCKTENIGDEIFNIPNNYKRVINKNYAFQIAWLLQGVIKNGTGKKLKFISNNIAGKTGTTNKNKDAWFIGFSSNLLVGVYVGYDQPISLGEKETGGAVAAPIWGNFMQNAINVIPGKPFQIPKDIELVKIDAMTGLLPNIDTKKKIYEAFVKGTAPLTNRQNIIGNDKKIKPLEGQIY